MKSFVSLVIPCYNEEGNIAMVLKDADRALHYMLRSYEIIVVNDGSTDRTASILEKSARSIPSLRVVSHESNRGYGAAVTTGFKSAKGDTIVMVDGDGQFDMRELSYMLKDLKFADIVIGYRLRRRDPFIRSLNSLIYNWAVRFCFGVWVRDLNCSMKGFKRQVLDELHVISDGALVNADILVQSIRRGFKIVEVPVHHFPRKAGIQTGARIRVIARSLMEFARLFMREFPLRYLEFSIKQRTTIGLVLAVFLLLLSKPVWGWHLVWGLLISLMGIAVRSWAAGTLRKTKILACSGPYAYIRNPLYAGSFLIGIGFCFLVHNQRWWILDVLFYAVLAVFFFGVYRSKVIEEERHLKRLFGDEYTAYSLRVPRFIPRGRRCFKNQEPFSWDLWIKNNEYNALIGYGAALFWIINKTQ
jgi:glycosyltransferase involved in cell wall biosynthesis